jgi:glycosyltransferase involved in cell wall biosynthesis
MTLPHPGLLTAIARFQPHVIHILDEGFFAAFAQVAATLFLTPTVWSHHSRLDKFCEAYLPLTAVGGLELPLFVLQLLRRTFASASDVHLSVGEDMRRQLLNAGCGPHVSEWVCGVDAQVFSPARRAAGHEAGGLRWRLTGGRPHLPILLYVGRVAPEKRLALLPAVARAAVERLRRAAGGGGGGGAPEEGEPALAIVIVGGGPFLEPLQALAARDGPTYTLDVLAAGAAPVALRQEGGGGGGAYVTTFCGQVGHGEALGALYATADLFFSPSTCETLGQVFQEAMAAGTVPAGADAAGVPTVLGRSGGHLFRADDADAAADAVASGVGPVLADAERAAELLPVGAGLPDAERAEEPLPV